MRVVWLVLFTCLVALTARQVVAGETITVRADSWPPYNGEPGDEKPGYGIEVLKAIFEPKAQIDYQVMPWSRAVDSTRNGKFNAIIGAATDDAEGFVFPQQPIGINVNAFFVKDGNPWRFENAESLSKIKIGVINGYSYGEVLNAYIEAHKADANRVVVVSGDDALEKLTKMVQAGRIGAFIENPLVVAEQGEDAQGLVQAGLAEDKDWLYVAFSPAKDTSAALAKQFDEGIAELRKSGALKTILDKYGVKDWQD